MSKATNTTKSVAIIIIFTLGSKIIGFIREMLIAAKFGSGTETDTLFIALTAITLITMFFTQAMNTTLIPILSEVERNKGSEEKKTFTNNLLNLMVIISLLIVVAGWAFAPVIIRLLAHGFEERQFDQTLLLFRIGLPALFFANIAGVFRGYLQSEMKFTESAVAEFPINFVYIFFLVFFAEFFGRQGLMLASIVAVGSQILIQIPVLRKLNFRYNFVVNTNDPHIKKMLPLVMPILISVAVSDINKIVDRSLASTLASGSISALNYANIFKGLTTGIFSTAIVTVLFPLLSKKADKDNLNEFKLILRYGFNTILLIMIPASVAMIVLAEPIIKAAFERGAFDKVATNMTASALIFYSAGIAGMGLKSFLNRVYYSLQDTKTPMYNGFIAIGLNIVLNLILIQFMDHRGLALATSISAIIGSLLLLIGLKRKIGPLGMKCMLITGIKVLISSVIMGLVTLQVYRHFSSIFFESTINDLIVLLFSSGFGLFIYLLLIYSMKVEELYWFINLAKKRFLKNK